MDVDMSFTIVRHSQLTYYDSIATVDVSFACTVVVVYKVQSSGSRETQWPL